MRQQRGIVLASVTVVAAAALWTTVALIGRAHVEAAGINGGLEDVQRRAAMRSAVLVLASQIFDQRGVLRGGEQPEIEPQITLWESGPMATVCRFVALPEMGVLSAEAGRLDLNIASDESLEVLAPEAILLRSQGRIEDVRDLIPSLSSPVIEWTANNGGSKHLTVFAHEPNMQSSGDARINLATPWSEELATRILDRFGAEVVEILKEISEEDPIRTDGDLATLLLAYSVPAEDWVEAFDAFTTDDGAMRRGRVDLNTASAEVLAAVPGITQEQADAIVMKRVDIGDELRATPVWPFTEGLLPPEVAPVVMNHVTVGAWTWRATIACGEVPADDPEATLRGRMAAEVVIDVAGPRPRIASWRDITMRDAAVAWPETADSVEEESMPDEQEIREPVDSPADGSSDPPATEVPVEERLGRWLP